MKKNIYSAMLLAFAAMPIMAQETYQDADLETGELNGTARYVGMGGALEALGADISTISTNPAGIGMFRRSWAGGTMGLNIQPKDESVGNDGKTVFSFDQLGFVFASRQSETSWLNFGVNYHKSRDFNQILAACREANGGNLGGSQNTLTLIKDIQGYGYDSKQTVTSAWSANDDLQETYLENFCYDETTSSIYNNLINAYYFNREKTGYIGEYDINVSGNQNDRIYWGLTVGIKDVHYSDHSEYFENIVDASNSYLRTLHAYDDRIISGQGFNIKGGVIIRPIEDSPFRFGLSVSSPTWYELTSSCKTSLYRAYDGKQNTEYIIGSPINDSYKFKLFTPWKFGLSLGHTIDNCLALGLSYEYADYGSLDNRIITSEEEYMDGSSNSSSISDTDMNRHVKQSLQGVSTLKLGAEYKIDNNFSVRLGYNYVSPIFKSDAQRGAFVESYGNYHSSSTDFTNWKSTNRITAGFGYQKDGISIDLAYMYTIQKGTFYPYASASTQYENADGTTDTLTNYSAPCDVKNERHKIMMTLGFRL